LSFFDPLTVNGPGYGWYGAIITPTDEEQDVLYTYNVFGAEAGFRNLFSVDGTDVYTHAGGNNLSKVSKASYSGSTLNFSFRTNTTGKPGAPSTLITNDLSATTGNNNTTPKTPNFFASFDLKKNTAGTNPLTGDVLWLFLDDGHPVDDNHDDLLVSITATPIPVPTLLPLFGAALGLVSVVRRRAA
jgi:hypothetical protein